MLNVGFLTCKKIKNVFLKNCYQTLNIPVGLNVFKPKTNFVSANVFAHITQLQ